MLEVRTSGIISGSPLCKIQEIEKKKKSSQEVALKAKNKVTKLTRKKMAN